MIRIAIVEDEDSYRRQLQQYASKFAEETDTDIKIASFSDGIHLTENYKAVYDVIFLDIQMPLLDGMETARRIRALDQEVILIFVTNMEQYALKGYEVHAYDFIVKPLGYPTFEQKMRKVARILSNRPSKNVMVPVSGSMLKISVNDVYYIETVNHRLLCHTVDGVKTLSSGTLLSWEQELCSAHFSRCNQCYLVNLRHVTAIHGDSVAVGGDELKISRPRKKDFLRELTAFVGEG